MAWLLRLNYLAPDAIGGYFVAAFLVATVILDTRGGVFNAASCEMDAAHESAVVTSAVFAGLSGGCLLVLLVTMFGSPSSRRWPIRAAAWAFAMCIVHFAFNALHMSPFVCVRALGGYSSAVRPQQPMELVFWFCTLVPEVWAVACLARQPSLICVRLMVAIVILLAAGFVSTFTDIFALWIATLVISSVAHVGVTIFVYFLLRAAHAQSRDDFTRQLVASTAPVLTVVWCAYPAWWLVAQFSIVTPGSELVGWRIITFSAKFALASLLMCGNFLEQAKLVEDELAVYEEQRRRADGRDEAKRLFVRYILHEIRVPLQGGQLAIQELQLGLDAGELVAAPTVSCTGSCDAENGLIPFRSAAETASASISTVGKLLDDFLSIAKIEDGRMTFEPFDVPLNGLLREATVVFTNALRAKGLQLRLSLAPDVPASVFVDGARVRQIISNFLSNAIKFSPQGGEVVVHVRRVLRAPAIVLGGTDAAAALVPGFSSSLLQVDASNTVTSSLHRASASPGADRGCVTCVDDMSPTERILHDRRQSSGGWTSRLQRKLSTGSTNTAPFLRVSVSDNGPGISAAEIPQLFQPYAQLHAGVQQKGLGTGLGLAICKGIAELMGGAVGVSSQPGAGATFWVEIPLSSPLAATPALVRPAAVPSADITKSGSGDGHAVVHTTAPRERAESPGAESHVTSTSSHPVSYNAPSNTTRSALSDRWCSAPEEMSVPVSSGSRAAAGRNVALHSIAVHVTTSDCTSDSESAALSILGSGKRSRPANPSPSLRIATRAVVVDDVRSNRELFARLLRRSGADIVFTAEHGLDALTQLQTALSAVRLESSGISDSSRGDVRIVGEPNPQLDGADALVDVWFVDGSMPVMDGLELTRRLREAGVCAPIIAVTGNALAEDQAAFRQAGANVVLTKPLTVSKLHEGLASGGLALPWSLSGRGAPVTRKTLAACPI